MSEPLVGWRVYKLARPHYLIDLGSRSVTEPRTPNVAFCPNNENHYAPEKDCMCGLWSFRTLQELVNQHYHSQGTVLAEVYSWGKVQVSERCYRAEYSYPKHLYLLDSALRPLQPWLQELFGVPVDGQRPTPFPTATYEDLSAGGGLTYQTNYQLYPTEEECWKFVLDQRVPLADRRAIRQHLMAKYREQETRYTKTLDRLQRELLTKRKQLKGVQDLRFQLNLLKQEWES